MNNEPRKPGASAPEPKVFDVMRPGKAPANATTRPLIVGHKPQVHDPLLLADHYDDDGYDASARPVLMNASTKVKLEPSAAVAPISMPDEPAASVAAPAPQAASIAPAAPTPSAPAMPTIDDSFTPEPPLAPTDIARVAVPEPAPTPVMDPSLASIVNAFPQTPPADQPTTDIGVAAVEAAVAPPADLSQPQVEQASMPSSASPTEPEKTPAPTSVAAPESAASTTLPPESNAFEGGPEELDFSQMSKPHALPDPAASAVASEETDDDVLAGMSGATLIDTGSIVVSHHQKQRGFKKAKMGSMPGNASTTTSAISGAKPKRHFPWVGLLVTIILVLIVTAIALDLMLDGGFISNVFRGHTIPHTHFFKN